MVKTYDEIFCLICESKMSNDDVDFEYFIESKLGDNLIKVSRAKFLKDHDYDKETKTIKLSGKRYKVNPGFSSQVKISSLDGTPIYSARMTGADTTSDDPKIILDKNFFKIIGKKSKEAVVQHEVGHLKMHSRNPNSKVRDSAFASKNTFADMIKASLGAGYDKETTREIIKESLKDPNVRKILKSKSGEISDSERKKLRDIMKKYSRGGHSNPSELEADRYGANRTSNMAMASGVAQYQFHANRERKKVAKKGVDDLEKMLKKDPKQKEMYDSLSPNGDYVSYVRDSGQKALSKERSEARKELVNRVRALHNKKLQQAKIYKRESTEELLD